MRTCLALALVLVACGDNEGGSPPDAPIARCQPPERPLPTEGQFADPRALPLPATCVEGGLREIPGRWFVSNPDSIFSFFYPKFEGTCETGFQRANFVDEDDHDISDDGFTFHRWSDGTRLYYRYNFRFEISAEETFEFTYALVACMLPDGTLAVTENDFDNDSGVTTQSLIGKRFAPKDGPAAGLSLVGSMRTYGADGVIVGYNVAVEGDHAYVVGPTGLDIIDVSDPAAPAHVSHVPGRYNDVKVTSTAAATVAYASPLRGDDGTYVIDVTDPAAPVQLAMISEYSHSVFVDGNALYLATYTNVVPKYDITNPKLPVRLGGVTLGGEDAGVHDLYASGTRIYANNTTAGLVVVDAATGLGTAIELGRTPASYSHASWAGTAGGRPIVLHGDEGMTGTSQGGAFLRVLEGDPTAGNFLADIGRYQSRPEVGIHNFQLAGDKAYIAYYQDGVRVVDLTDPTQPREVAHYNTYDFDRASGGGFEGALGIRVVGDLIFVADSDRGLLVLRETP